MDKDEEFPEVGLDTLNDGVLNEHFGMLMEKVKENILDPNTSWKAKREITLKIVFKPNEERDRATVTVTPTCKLAAVESHEGRIALGFVDGTLTARTIPTTEQEVLPFTPKAVSKKAANE